MKNYRFSLILPAHYQDSSSGVVSSREHKPDENKCFPSEDSHSENKAGE